MDDTERGLSSAETVLIYCLAHYPISDETSKAIFCLLETDEMKLELITYMIYNAKATEQELLNEMARIIKEHKAAK